MVKTGNTFFLHALCPAYIFAYIFAFQGLNEKNEVGIIGHRVTYSNGVEPHEQMTRPPSSSVKLPVPESVRALKIGKG